MVDSPWLLARFIACYECRPCHGIIYWPDGTETKVSTKEIGYKLSLEAFNSGKIDYQSAVYLGDQIAKSMIPFDGKELLLIGLRDKGANFSSPAHPTDKETALRIVREAIQKPPRRRSKKKGHSL